MGLYEIPKHIRRNPMSPIDFLLAVILIAIAMSLLGVTLIFVTYFQVQLAEEVSDRRVKTFLETDEPFDEAMETVPDLHVHSKIW